MLEEKDRKLQEAEERWNKFADEYEEVVQEMDDRINDLEMEKQDMSEELGSALLRGKEMEALLEDARARELEMKSSLLSLEERLQQKDCQIEDMLSVERRLKLEKQQLAKKIKQDDIQMASLLAELEEAENEIGHCFNIIQEKENSLKDYFEGEIKKKDEVIEKLHEELGSALLRGKEMEALLEDARARELEIKSSLLSLEERLQQKDCQIEDMLSVERRLKLEKQQLAKKIKQDDIQMASLLAELEEAENEIGLCFNIIQEKENSLKDYFEGEIKKKDEVIEKLHDQLEVALQREKEMESFLIEVKGNERKVNLFKELLEHRNSQVKELLLEVERLKGENEALEQKWANALIEAGLEQQLLRQRAEEYVEISFFWQQKFEEVNKEVEMTKHREEDLRGKLKDCEKEMEMAVNSVREMKDNVKLAEDQLNENHLFIKEKEEEHNEMKMQYQEDLKEKDDEIERLLEMVRNLLQEQERAREQQRIKEQTLRNEDKYLLMALLHGIAERNFHLDHIALEHGNENQQNITEEEQQGKERNEELFDYMQRRKQEQYNRAQQERNNYMKQWSDLTQMLEALMCGDESVPELRNGISGQNSEIETHTDNKTYQGHDDIQVLQKEYDEVSRRLKEAKDRLEKAEEKAQEAEGKLREAECKLTQKNTQIETLDHRAVLKSEVDRCIDDQDFDSALALLRIIVKRFGNELECRVKEVRCLLTLARTDEAQDVLNDLPKEFKDSFIIKIESALLSACNLEFWNSRNLLSQVLDICPNHPRALIAQKFIEQRMLWEALPGMIDAKDYDIALENIAVAMSLGCLYPWVSVDLARIKGNILCSLGKLQEACECFISVLAVDEDQEDCRLRLGLCFLLLGRHTDAINEFTRLDEDKNGEYLISLAEDLEKMQQYGCPYRVLGVETDVALDEIRIAYRKSALKYHPDKNKEADKDSAHLLMLQINYANDLLSNKKEKKKYDNTRQALEEYAAEVFKNPNLPEWLEDDDEVDESESDCDWKNNSDSDDESDSGDESESDSEDDSDEESESDSESDSDDESESDSEDDSDVEGNLALMECSHSDYLENESSFGQLEEEDDDEVLEDEEDENEDDAWEDIPNEEYLEESDEEGDEYDADDEDNDDAWEDIPNEESSEGGDEIDATSGEESQDECDSDSVEESDDDSDDE
ncbi:putative uncharacterized protein MYH16 [Macrobrachium nipponense]|uniref:putative uncharacterized protein MYH16 n=1 Tax=Macrobrachium nipponense TaxID=159736 RepID=UPI0030C88768